MAEHCGGARYDRLAYEGFALPHYAGKDPAHDVQHIKRILARLDMLSMGLKPPPRKDWLYFLACFHGLGKRIRADLTFRTEVEGFLTSLGWEANEIAGALASLDRHVAAPLAAEERIVHDANALEVVGAFGIAKAFTKGGAEGQSYQETLSIYEGFLERVRFQTPVGQALAHDRQAYARAFLDRFRMEAGMAETTEEQVAPEL